MRETHSAVQHSGQTVQAVALTSGARPLFLSHCSQNSTAPATIWIQKHWWHLALWSQLQSRQNQSSWKPLIWGSVNRHVHNPASNSKTWNKAPRREAPGCLPATTCHAGVSFWPSPGLILAHSLSDSPQGSYRGISYANMMIPPTKGLFMHSRCINTCSHYVGPLDNQHEAAPPLLAPIFFCFYNSLRPYSPTHGHLPSPHPRKAENSWRVREQPG